MIVDTNLFTPGSSAPLAPDTLLVVEEMPGHISAIDRTPVLASQGYWSSYNVPSDPAIFNISGASGIHVDPPVLKAHSTASLSRCPYLLL